MNPRRKAAAAAVALLCGACDLSTGLPKLNPTYAIELDRTSISVAQLLPSSMTLGENNSAFLLTLDPVTVSQSLGAVCPPCVALNGQTVPKPAFTATLSGSAPLPNDVVRVNLTAGWVRYTITHAFSFDPLRPGGATPGTLTLIARSGTGAVIGSKTISGADRAFPTGSTLTDSVAVAGVVDRVDITVELNSPAGNAVTIDTNSRITMTAAPVDLRITSADISVQNRVINTQQTQLDLTGVDRFVVNRVRGGRLVLTIENNFNVTADLSLDISGGLQPISKITHIPVGSSRVEIPFSEAELKSILGRSVTLSFAGPVSSNGTITLLPSATFTVAPLLVLELES